MKNVQAQFQMLDSYIREYNIKINGKIAENMEMKITGQIEFGIVKITEKDSLLIGEIELCNTLNITVKNETKAQIKIAMRGLFQASKDIKKEEFEEMLKLNGATTLSQLIRAYIHTNTALSGIPSVITPMINFVEFFNQQV